MKQSLIFGAACLVIGFLACLKMCGHETVKEILVSDTIRIPAIHDTLTAKEYFIKYKNGTHDTTILQRIDTLFREGAIERLTVCADTIHNADTVKVCYDYVLRKFDIGLRFAPRIHDTVVTFKGSDDVTKQGTFSYNVTAGADYDFGGAWLAGIGAEANVWKLRVSGLVGVANSGIGLRANARVIL